MNATWTLSMQLSPEWASLLGPGGELLLALLVILGLTGLLLLIVARLLLPLLQRGRRLPERSLPQLEERHPRAVLPRARKTRTRDRRNRRAETRGP